LSSPLSSDAPQTRSRAKAKASKDAKLVTMEPTPLTSLFVQDMDAEQIWEQLDLRGKKICDMLKIASIGTDETGDKVDRTTERVEVDDAVKRKALETLLEENFGIEADQIDALETLLEENFGIAPDQIDAFLEAKAIAANSSDSDSRSLSSFSSSSGEDLGEGIEMLRDSTSPSDDEEEVEGPPRKSRPASQQRSPLDDVFFDLASFNAETEEAEGKRTSKKPLEELDIASDEEDKEDGEDVDLFRSVDDSEEADGDAENPSGNFIHFSSPTQPGDLHSRAIL
jgi:U3 small nucleolar RNA-associated protein MPP10